MRKALLLLTLLALPLVAQDEAKIKELIQNLDDDSFEVREKAEKALIAAGSAAIPHLKTAIAEAENQKEKAEIKVRATSALRAIEFSEKARQYYSEPKPVTLHAADAELGEVLKDLEKQTGVRLDAAILNLKAKITLDFDKTTLFKVLDEICRGQEERSYEYKEDAVHFVRAAFVPCPTAYEGPFRIRMVKLKHERSTDFKKSDGQVQLVLDADWQKYLKPSKKIDFEIRSATDDKGASLEASRTGSAEDGNDGVVVMGNGRFVMRRNGMVVGGMTGEEQINPSFTLKGMSAGATKISLQGTARFSFPLDKTDVVFDKPAAAEPQPAGDVTFALKSQAAGRIWRVTLTHTPGRPAVTAEDVDARVDKDSFVAIDDAGKEHKAQLNDARGGDMQFVLRGGEVPDGTPLVTYQAMFPTLQNRAPKEIRFKFVNQIFVKTVSFTLSDIPLP